MIKTDLTPQEFYKITRTALAHKEMLTDQYLKLKWIEVIYLKVSSQN